MKRLILTHLEKEFNGGSLIVIVWSSNKNSSSCQGNICCNHFFKNNHQILHFY